MIGGPKKTRGWNEENLVYVDFSSNHWLHDGNKNLDVISDSIAEARDYSNIL